MAKRRKADPLDTEIENLYYRYAAGRQINVLNIAKIFAAGRTAHADGRDLSEAIKDAINEFCEPV